MKYWCYYTDVVRYLEKLEALCAPKTQAPAYLIWQDDGGPSMIVGPGVEWYRGDGPPPHIDAITLSLINRAVNRAVTARECPWACGPIGAATVRKRLLLPTDPPLSASGPPRKMKTRGFSTERSARTSPNRKKPHEISAEQSCTETRPKSKKTSGVSTEQSRVETPPNRTTQNQAAPPARSKQSNQSKAPRMWRAPPGGPRRPPGRRCRHSCRHHQIPGPARKPATPPARKANKRRTNFPKPAQTCSLSL